MKLVWFLRILAIWFAFYNIVTNVVSGDTSDLAVYYCIAAGGFVPSILLWWLSCRRTKKVKAHAKQ